MRKRKNKKGLFWDSSKSHFWNETWGRWGFSKNMSWIWLPADNMPFGSDNYVFPAWLLYMIGAVQFVPCKNASFNRALTGFAIPWCCTCPAVFGPYHMVICETFSNLLHVNCPNSEKTHAFLKKLWEGIKATVIIQGTLLAGSLESGQVTVQI